MPVYQDFTLYVEENGTLTIGMQPPAPISGWSLQFTLMKRFGSTTPLLVKSMASGFVGGQSGMSLIDGNQGRFSVALNPAEVSGLDPGAYAYQIIRTDPNLQTVVSEGYRLMGQ